MKKLYRYRGHMNCLAILVSVTLCCVSIAVLVTVSFHPGGTEKILKTGGTVLAMYAIMWLLYKAKKKLFPYQDRNPMDEKREND